MQIKVTNYGTSTNVSVIHPGTEERSVNLGLSAGQAITLTAQNEHDASGIVAGEVEVFAVPAVAVPTTEQTPECECQTEAE